MPNNCKSTDSTNSRSERGAALITTLMVATLLLAAGGALILTTALAGTVAVDATAEMQAYYSAEAGLEAALMVMRGNKDSSPAGTRATFRNIDANSNLSTWLGDISHPEYDLEVTDPDRIDPATGLPRSNHPAYQPSRLIVQSTGHGPRGATKKMEMVVKRAMFDASVYSTITLPNQSADPIIFNLGSSTVTSYSGVDNAGLYTSIPAFAVGASDYTATNNVIDGCHADGTNCSGSTPEISPAPADPSVISDTNVPDFLRSPADARNFLYNSDPQIGAKAYAESQSTYYDVANGATPPTTFGNYTRPKFTFIDGNFTLGPGNPTGVGVLVVTGTLTLTGNFQFSGIIYVLGGGTVLRSGGGHGDIFGAIFVSKFPLTPPVPPASDLFQAPTFNTDGAGTANIQYDTQAIARARTSGGKPVIGVREY
jgi:hypothetical protein